MQSFRGDTEQSIVSCASANSYVNLCVSIGNYSVPVSSSLNATIYECLVFIFFQHHDLDLPLCYYMLLLIL